MHRTGLAIVATTLLLSSLTKAERCSATSPCSNGACCSQYLWCGRTYDYCGFGCVGQCDGGEEDYEVNNSAEEVTVEVEIDGDSDQVETGRCNAETPCSDGSCCSQYNWCGTSEDHCGTGCQSNCSGSADQHENADAGNGNHSNTNVQDTFNAYQRCIAPGLIAMTFDDGPGAYTRTIMDALDAFGVVGTFFVIGSSVDSDPTLAAEIVQRGHEIASHSFSHANLPLLTTSQIYSELQSTSSSIAAATGRVPAFFRPPYGAYDANVVSIAESLGQSSVMWNLDTFDWRDREPATIRSTFSPILSADASSSSYITLQHDINEGSAAAISDILMDLKATNFRFVKVSECIGVAAYQ